MPPAENQVLALNCQGFYPVFVESPCIKNCTYDPIRQICAGCGRRLDEIAAWADMNDQERSRIMAELPGRLKRVKPG
jgi:predicted Fe-S protein YdhL (DUF1289 family)